MARSRPAYLLDWRRVRSLARLRHRVPTTRQRRSMSSPHLFYVEPRCYWTLGELIWDGWRGAWVRSRVEVCLQRARYFGDCTIVLREQTMNTLVRRYCALTCHTVRQGGL